MLEDRAVSGLSDLELADELEGLVAEFRAGEVVGGLAGCDGEGEDGSVV